MRMFHRATLIVITLSTATTFADDFDDCILKNVGSAKTPHAVVQLREACRRKTMPLKCKEIKQSKPKPSLDEFMTAARTDNPRMPEWALLQYWEAKYGHQPEFSDEQLRCFVDCQYASTWSRTVGECRT